MKHRPNSLVGRSVHFDDSSASWIPNAKTGWFHHFSTDLSLFIIHPNILHQPNLCRDQKYIDNPNRNKNKIKLDKIINKVFSKLKASEVEIMLNKHNIANSRLNTVEDLSNHSLINNGEAIISNEIIRIANLPVLSENKQNTKVPNLGEHTKSIKSEFN